ncbi:hypothetical protein PIROE2DRAFT_67796, partial [Piromyces sp. E2]
MFSIKYPHLNLGFSWIIRLRYGFSYNTIITIRSGRVTNDCPRTRMCPCCGQGEQSFDHWVFSCSALSSYRSLNELRIDSRERRHLNKLLIESLSESPVSYI